MRKLLRELAIYAGLVVLLGVTFAAGILADAALQAAFPWTAP